MKNALSPVHFLARSAFVYRDKIAIIDGERQFTYGEFQRRVHRLASALRQHGVGPGDRVAVLAPNTPAALEPHFGVPLLGAVLVMLNFRLSGAELAWILNHCGAKVLIADPQFLPVLDPVRGELRHLQLITDDYEGLLAQGTLPLTDLPEIDEDSLMCINYTSGTTGFPKGVMFSHRGAYINSLGEVMEYGLKEDSVYLWT